MSLLLKAVLVGLVVFGGATTGYVFYNGALSPDNWVYQGGKATNCQNGGVHGAPGPIAGAGLTAEGPHNPLEGGTATEAMAQLV